MDIATAVSNESATMVNLTDKIALVESLRNIYDSSNFWNVKLVVGKSRRFVFAVKFILSARSRVFEELLKTLGRDKESFLIFRKRRGRQKGMDILYFPEHEYNVFKDFISYLHCGTLLLDAENIIPMLSLADTFEVTSLSSLCLEFLRRNISQDNACYLHKSVDETKFSSSISIASKIIINFIYNSAKEIFKKTSFGCLERDQFIFFLTNESSKLSELEKFMAAVMWTKIQWANCRVESFETINDLFLPFLNHISLNRIPIKDLVEDVRRSRMVPDQILAHACARNKSPDVSARCMNTTSGRLNCTLPRKGSDADPAQSEYILIGLNKRATDLSDFRNKRRQDGKGLVRSNSARSTSSQTDRVTTGEKSHFLCPPNIGNFERLSTSAPCLHIM